MILTNLKYGPVQIYFSSMLNQHFLLDSASVESWCSQEDFLRWKNFSSLQRKREFAAVRYLLSQLGYSKALYYSKEIPMLHLGEHIAISHSGDHVGIALCSEFSVGFDIEKKHLRTQKVYEKFVHPKERDVFTVNDLEMTTLLWSFKETVYKVMRIENLNFSEQICILRDEAHNFKAEVTTNKGIFELPLKYQVVDDLVITFNIGDVQSKK